MASWKPEKSLWVKALCAFFLVVLFSVAYGNDFRVPYASYPYHRMQVDALLHGHLFLSRSIENLDFDLAYTRGQLNQIWGLGVPIWMLPFEVICRAIGLPTCPDLIPMLTAVALFGWYAAGTGLLISKVFRNRFIALLVTSIVIFYPPFWHLVFGGHSIYDDTILYACLLSISIVLGSVRFLLGRRTLDFAIVCVLSALSGFVRPTHAIYGVMGALVCGYSLIRSISKTESATSTGSLLRRYKKLALGWGIVAIGFGSLAISNVSRFGSPFEFGHRLTATTPEITYFTRFDTAIGNLGVVEAGRELFAWLFLLPFKAPFSPVPGQTHVLRYRDAHEAVFDPSYALICGLGLILATAVGYNRFRRSQRIFCGSQPVCDTIIGIQTLSLSCWLALFLFYLRFPTLASRYMFDFAPAFLALMVVTWILAALQWRLLAVCGGPLWLAAEMGCVWVHPDVRLALNAPQPDWQGATLPSAHGRDLAEFGGRYSVQQHPWTSGIRYNGSGWDANGFVNSTVTLAIDSPEFLNIQVYNDLLQADRSKTFQARIDGYALKSISVVPVNTTDLKISFEMPATISRESNNHLLFLCFTTNMQSQSLVHLREVRWR